MYDIKQNTAITIPFFAHGSDGVGVTGKVSGDWTKRISKNSGAFGAATITVTEMENGFYGAALDTGHTDTLGVLTMTFAASGTLQVNLQFRVEVRLKEDLAYPATSGRSLLVAAAGGVALDWANVQGATTAVNLSGTNIDVDQVVASVSGNVGGNVTGSVGSVATGGIAATSFAAGAINAAAIADGAIDAATFATGAINAAAIASDAITDAKVAADVTIASVTGNVGGNVVGSVGTIAANGIASTSFATGAITSGAFAAGAIDAAAIANAAIDAATFAAGAIDAAALATDAVNEIQAAVAAGAVASVTGAVGSVTGAVGSIGTGGITAASFAAGAIDNAAIATDAIGSNELAATAANKIRDTILADSVAFNGANINASIGSRATPAQVNAEMLDVLQTDLFAELASVPGASSSLKDKITFLFMLARNKITQTATTQTLFADDGSTQVGTSTVSDDSTTFTKGEFA